MGIEPVPGGGSICLSARREGKQLLIDVADTGAGLRHPAAAPGQGLGLANVRDRLAALYGPAAHLSVQQQDGGGVSPASPCPGKLTPRPACPLLS